VKVGDDDLGSAHLVERIVGDNFKIDVKVVGVVGLKDP
jgi:hypothetical protein